MTLDHAEKVLNFWFNILTPEDWFKKSEKLDREITDKFKDIHKKAAISELFEWRTTPKGSLAEIIILDQFSRNIYRNKPQAFSSDPLSLALAQTAIKKNFDAALQNNEKAFLYMPFMHSESKLIHKKAVELYNQPGLENNYNYELKHKEIIDRFNRYPHRNLILNRESTSEELEFLKQKGTSF